MPEGLAAQRRRLGIFACALRNARAAYAKVYRLRALPPWRSLTLIKAVPMRRGQDRRRRLRIGRGSSVGDRMSKSSLISLVEDDRFFRESMQRLMRSLGYAVEAFSSATDFLASPRLDETTCLIADVHMPTMSGIELYRHLVADGRTIPTILVTAYPNDAERTCALNDGVVGYLRKPVDERNLLRCLRAALTAGQAPDEEA